MNVSTEDRPPAYRAVGIILACISGILIGVSFVVKKKGLLQATEKSQREPGEGFAYLRNWVWWCGMTLMILGELCNAAAYGFIDAIVITSLGGLAVVTTAVLSSIFLKERLPFIGKISCVLCLVGSVVVVLNAPHEALATNIQDFKEHFVQPGWLAYMCTVLTACAVLAIFVAPRWGSKSMFVHTGICSLAGGITVMCIQGVGSAITAQARGVPQFNQWFLYIAIIVMVVTLAVEIIYLNKALNIFNTAMVTPTYYVLFTTMTIISSAVLFRGFDGSATSIVNMVLGFLVAAISIFLLQVSLSSASTESDSSQASTDLDDISKILQNDYYSENEAPSGGALAPSILLRELSTRRRKTISRSTRASQPPIPVIHEDESRWRLSGLKLDTNPNALAVRPSEDLSQKTNWKSPRSARDYEFPRGIDSQSLLSPISPRLGRKFSFLHHSHKANKSQPEDELGLVKHAGNT
ncbi:hypothetical protein CANCADRAFT_31578 [Tortispora caseinolytica NRRL Y-17796]|uniref:Uncharacterized protein n=1 Tax=Tortispora caseinolytica NRRL Y-17796 TaxID=767744 RepID=A0A1E4TG11_9ASCO|nr:hypothetical protein CANCADRAFT_31578 [Tortispora caseinolytica NRRL Y-17796]